MSTDGKHDFEALLGADCKKIDWALLLPDDEVAFPSSKEDAELAQGLWRQERGDLSAG